MLNEQEKKYHNDGGDDDETRILLHDIRQSIVKGITLKQMIDIFGNTTKKWIWVDIMHSFLKKVMDNEYTDPIGNVYGWTIELLRQIQVNDSDKFRLLYNGWMDIITEQDSWIFQQKQLKIPIDIDELQERRNKIKKIVMNGNVSKMIYEERISFYDRIYTSYIFNNYINRHIWLELMNELRQTDYRKWFFIIDELSFYNLKSLERSASYNSIEFWWQYLFDCTTNDILDLETERINNLWETKCNEDNDMKNATKKLFFSKKISNETKWFLYPQYKKELIIIRRIAKRIISNYYTKKKKQILKTVLTEELSMKKNHLIDPYLSIIHKYI